MNNCQKIIDFLKKNYIDITFISIILLLLLINYIFINYSSFPLEQFSINTQPIDLLDNLLKQFNSTISHHYRINPNHIVSTHQYYNNTIPTEIRHLVTSIITTIINDLNCVTNSNYHLLNYDTIIIQTDSTTNKLIIADFFIYQSKYNIITRLITEFCISNTRNLHINYINISNK